MNDQSTLDTALSHLPPGIRKRIQGVSAEIQAIFDRAEGLMTAPLSEKISFRFENAAIGPDILTAYERAQSISFVTRFENLPVDQCVDIVEKDGRFYITNMPEVRNALHEYRPIVQNQRDSVHYQNLHRTWRGMLVERDLFKRTVVTVIDERKEDVTPTFVTWMEQSNKAIRSVIQSLEFGYLYNGFLQHSDPNFTERFLDDYVSGELNYILMKHISALAYLKERLLPYYAMARALTFPRLGFFPGDDHAG
jgi:hypothetical protein